MNLEEIKSAIKHLQKTCKCPNCKIKYKNTDNIQVIATTKNEGLLELVCESCKGSTFVTVVVTSTFSDVEVKEQNREREHQSISENDVLDVKNFLNKFDGDFKKIFKT